MIKKHTNTILNFVLVCGLAIYIFLTITSGLSSATIWTIVVLYVWVLASLYLKEFNFQKFITICCYVGFLFSITYLLSFGLEELPYPEGAIMFHSKPIAVSLLFCFISTIPLLYRMTEKPQHLPDQNAQPTLKKETQKFNEKWEEATLDDLESGEYEPI